MLGNPLYLLGTSLARYRIWDGMRGLDYLTSLPEVDPSRIGCVGNSGGGTLTAYIAALDPRVTVAAICCYITTLRRRMGNRIQEDPSADPEQDIFGFVSEGIDHAGLLAMRVPRPTLLGTARFDFFPIEGAREIFARRSGSTRSRAPAIGSTAPRRPSGTASPRRFARPSTNGSTAGSPAGRTETPVAEFPVKPRPDTGAARLPRRPGQPYRSDPGRSCRWPWKNSSASKNGPASSLAGPAPSRSRPGGPPHHRDRRRARTRTERPSSASTATSRATGARRPSFLEALRRRPCGHGGRSARRGPVPAEDSLSPAAITPTRSSGVEENIAYNAFLVGKSLLGMRVTDVLTAVQQLAAKAKPRRVDRLRASRRGAGGLPGRGR